MNTKLIEKLILEQGYALDNINIDYDMMSCEYRIEVTLIAGNVEMISFKKSYSDASEDNLFDFGTDLSAIGHIFKLLAKKKEEE